MFLINCDSDSVKVGLNLFKVGSGSIMMEYNSVKQQ